MNTNLFNIVNRIVAEQGEGVLSEPRRVTAFFADLAKDEPKPQKNAFTKCLEHGFAQSLKNAAEPERDACKQRLAQRLHEEEGLDPELCGETLELLATVLFGEKIYCKNCGKELREEWKGCPYCLAPVTNQIIGSVISSGSGSKRKLKLEEDTVKRSSEIWVCGRCKTQNSFILDFCKTCGKEFNPPLW